MQAYYVANAYLHSLSHVTLKLFIDEKILITGGCLSNLLKVTSS